jgi:annexin A7/11
MCKNVQELCVALMGFGMDDDTLIRVITTRAEIDMQYIKLEFTNESKRLLEEVIAIDTSGSYRLFLLTLIGHGEVGLYSPSNTAGSASFFSASSSSRHQSNVSVASSRSSDHN